MTAIVGVDLDAIDHELYVASREVDGIPYTAPEVLTARARQLVPLAQDLATELRALRTQRDAVLTYLDEITAEAAAPPYPIPPPPWVVKIRQRMGIAP